MLRTLLQWIEWITREPAYQSLPSMKRFAIYVWIAVGIMLLNMISRG